MRRYWKNITIVILVLTSAFFLVFAQIQTAFAKEAKLLNEDLVNEMDHLDKVIKEKDEDINRLELKLEGVQKQLEECNGEEN